MTRYRVETRATVNRHRYVEAANVKEAEAKSSEATIDYEEDVDEETTAIVEERRNKMKLDRNINGTGRGKYGLVNNRALQEYLTILPGDITTRGTPPNGVETEALKVANAISFLEAMGVIDWGEAGTASEFFVIKLRDLYAPAALEAYAREAINDPDEPGFEYGEEIEALARRAGPNSPFCKKPD